MYVLCGRRVGNLGVSDSLSMVCTICCVHTILREGGDRLKMGSPDAYGSAAVGADDFVHGVGTLVVGGSGS